MFHVTLWVYHGTFTMYHGTFTMYHGSLKNITVQHIIYFWYVSSILKTVILFHDVEYLDKSSTYYVFRIFFLLTLNYEFNFQHLGELIIYWELRSALLFRVFISTVCCSVACCCIVACLEANYINSAISFKVIAYDWCW